MPGQSARRPMLDRNSDCQAMALIAGDCTFMLKRLGSIIDRLSGITGFLGACLVVPIALVMFYEVVLRFFFDLPTFWAYELTYMMAGAHFALGITYVTREGLHVRIDFLYERFPPRLKAGIDFCVSGIVVLPTVSWMAYLLVTKAIEALLIGELSGESEWNPYVWPVYTAIAIGFVAFSLQLAAEAVRRWRELIGIRTNAEH